jgi:hypothetical protein
LYPFTDIDTSSEDINQKWQSAKSDLVIMMRSWVGVVELSSGDMGFASLVRMLCDPKISVVVNELILDCISEICNPIVSKVNKLILLYIHIFLILCNHFSNDSVLYIYS